MLRYQPFLPSLVEALDYDPETGSLTWRTPPHPRIKRGSPAGTFNKIQGAIVIGFRGRKYQAHRLAYAMHHGMWPQSAVLFVDKDPTNLRIENLVLESDFYSTTDTAAKARHYRQQRKLQRSLSTANDRDPVSRYPGVIYSPYERHFPWQYVGLQENENERDVVLASYATQREAEQYAIDRAAAFTLIAHNPAVVRKGDDRIFTGPAENAMSLAVAKLHLIYDPIEGRLYWREPKHKRGLPAEYPRPSGILVVLFDAREYPAHMLAVFLTEGFWPRRKSVTWKNGKKNDNRWSNLVISADARTPSWKEYTPDVES